MWEDLRLAVTTPGGVKLDQNILLIVDNNVLIVVCNNGSHRSIVLFGYGLRLDARLNLTSQEIVNKLANMLLGELSALLERELLILGCVLNGESGPFTDFEVQILCMLTKSLCVDGGNVDLSLMLCGNGLECLCQFFTLLRSFSEDVGEGKARLKDVGLAHVLGNSHIGKAELTAM